MLCTVLNSSQTILLDLRRPLLIKLGSFCYSLTGTRSMQTISSVDLIEKQSERHNKCISISLFISFGKLNLRTVEKE